ncbi:MAG TPA: energy transducer TonB [Candidatus Angelobacter sp.]|nr:energy transducer TonB [Candidatus Angelobacter sp.]
MKTGTILTSLILVSALCALGPAEVAADQELERQLISQYRDKILALRHSFKSNSQEYDAEGRPVMTGEEGSWTVYGRIAVKKVVLDADKLRLEGTRVLYILEDRGKRLQPSRMREDVKITIQLKNPVNSADQVAGVLNLVFAISPEDVVKSAPSYWKVYLTEQDSSGQSQKKVGLPDGQTMQQEPNLGDNAPEHDQVFKVGEKGVSPPKILYQPEPEFSDLARKMSYQGTLGMSVLVDKSGSVRNVQVVHPLGMGLDENAVATIGTWRFEPAMRDGQPVVVSLYIEVSFQLGR